MLVKGATDFHLVCGMITRKAVNMQSLGVGRYNISLLDIQDGFISKYHTFRLSTPNCELVDYTLRQKQWSIFLDTKNKKDAFIQFAPFW